MDRYSVKIEEARNSLGMAITVYRVVDRDNETTCESRYLDVAEFVAVALNRRERGRLRHCKQLALATRVTSVSLSALSKCPANSPVSGAVCWLLMSSGDL